MGGRPAVLRAKGADHADGGYGLECGSRAAGSSEDGAAQGGEHAQAVVPLNAGRMGSYQPMLRRVPRRQEPLTPVTARPLEPF